MRNAPESVDWRSYAEAFRVLAANLGIVLPILIGVVVAVLLEYASGPLWDPIGGAGMGITNIITILVEGFAFGVSLIFADDAWRWRANLRSAWEQGKRRAANILIATLGFFFLLFVAGLIGGVLPVPYLRLVLQLLAFWAFIYAIPAASLGGVPGGGAFSASLQTAKRHPIATTALLLVCAAAYYGISVYALAAIAPHLTVYAWYASRILLESLAFGYVATVVARQYTDFAFRPYW